MTSLSERNEEENLEILEFYIDLLKEKVENYKNSNNLQHQKLNRFIAEYIDLEDKILNLLQEISVTDEKNEKKMEELTDVFTIYWSNFQDEWNDELWTIYNMYRNLNEKDGTENFDKNKNNFISSNNTELIIEDGTNKTISRDEKLNSSLFKKNNSQPRSSRNFATLNKIDQDIDNIAEIPVDKLQEDKKRNCVDFAQCTLF